MKIRLEHVNKQFEQTEAVRDVCLQVEHGELMALLGPSGCGKSTLLRMVAGLIPVSSGSIWFDEREVTTHAPQRRNTAMVFQSYALFPHMNVAENVAFGLQVRKVDKAEIKRRMTKILAMVELEGLERRKIQELSGGQRQRVALARAIIVEPDVLLFDEPLSNLDEKLRMNMRASIRQIQKELGITALYVTHDQEEAMSIADRITVMNEGRVLQIDTPEGMYYRPLNFFVADFVGRANVFVSDGVIQGGVNVLGQRVPCAPGLSVMLRPENIQFSVPGVGAQGVVVQKEALGFSTRYVVKIAQRGIEGLLADERARSCCAAEVGVLERLGDPSAERNVTGNAMDKRILVDTLGQQDIANPMVGDTVWLTFHPHYLHLLQK